MGPPPSYGFIITTGTGSSKDPAQLLYMARRLLEGGARVSVFLIGDGIYLARAGQRGPVAEALERAREAGAEIIVSSPHLKASGMPASSLLKGSMLEDRPYKEMVTRVMETWDRVVVC